jgi:hypothetical protein
MACLAGRNPYPVQNIREWCPIAAPEPRWDTGRHSTPYFDEMWEVSIREAEVVVFVPELSLKERFREQADKWQQETQHLSSPSQRMMHPSYQAIMGMASDNRDEVIDLMLRDMQQNRREWFWALSYLTHENPIERKDAGRLDKMIKAWVRWGQQRRGRR